MEALFSAVVDTLPANLWSPTTGALKAASNRLLSWRDDSLVGLAALARDTLGGPMPFRCGTFSLLGRGGACRTSCKEGGGV